jgi:hypothetical protein
MTPTGRKNFLLVQYSSMEMTAQTSYSSCHPKRLRYFFENSSTLGSCLVDSSEAVESQRILAFTIPNCTIERFVLLSVFHSFHTVPQIIILIIIINNYTYASGIPIERHPVSRMLQRFSRKRSMGIASTWTGLGDGQDKKQSFLSRGKKSINIMRKLTYIYIHTYQT